MRGIDALLSERPLVLPGLITALMLIAATGSWPYGYYTLLRWVTCTVGVAFALHGYSTSRLWAAWVFGLLALLFNPIVPVHLTRQVWRLLDLIAASALLAAAVIMTSRRQENGRTVG